MRYIISIFSILSFHLLGLSHCTDVPANISYGHELNQPTIAVTTDFGYTWLIQQEGSEEEIEDLRNVHDGTAFVGDAISTLFKSIKLDDTCSVSLSYEPASCSTCCDATVNVTPNSNCPPYTYSWSPMDPTSPPGSACPYTTYYITVTDSCGCVASDSITTDSIATGLNSAFSDKGVGFDIYPNPARNGAFVEPNNGHRNVAVKILDIYGRAVMNKDIDGKKWLELSHLPEGVYTIKLVNSTTLTTLGTKN